ncbi:MAG: outer membrane beta-barrel protein [Gammaproteobacteria bacterium]|nr:outer membrane beta-barrel protein [Gammaproteobacteria bacterium]
MAENFEPEGIRTGSVVFYPFAGITFGHDDNVLSQETDAVESGITTITAGLGMQVSSDNSRNNIEANLQVEDGKYDSSPDDDYQDGNFNLGYNYQPHDKLSLLTEIGVSKQHEPRAYDTVATRTSPDEYTDTTFDFDWNYGSKGVDGSDTSIAVNVTDRDYDTNLDLTEAYNRSTSMVSWYLHYPVAANTRMRLSARALNFDYDTTHSRSGNQARIMVGADWQASDFTLLSIEVGQQNKDFDEDTIEDESDSAWEVGFSWAPEEYSTFQVSSSKDFDESTSAANYLRNTSLDMTWIYGWNDNLKTTLGFGSGEETSVYATTDATDATKYASLSFQYAISPVAQFVGGYQATSVDSDSDGGSSDKSVINLGFKAAF